MRVGLDLDSTLSDFDLHWDRWIKLHDPEFRPEAKTGWDIHQFTKLGKSVYEYLWIPGVFTRARPRFGAQEVVKQLQKDGHELFVVSHSHPNVWAEKNLWLEKHFPEIPEDNRIPLKNKSLLRIDLLVDDGLHNFQNFNGHGVIFDQSWNREVPEAIVARTVRAKDWPEVYRQIEKYVRCEPGWCESCS
jgi:5'-nucleotidase